MIEKEPRLQRARDLENQPIVTRRVGETYYIGQGAEFVGLSRHEAKRVLHDLADFLNEQLHHEQIQPGGPKKV